MKKNSHQPCSLMNIIAIIRDIRVAVTSRLSMVNNSCEVLECKLCLLEMIPLSVKQLVVRAITLRNWWIPMVSRIEAPLMQMTVPRTGCLRSKTMGGIVPQRACTLDLQSYYRNLNRTQLKPSLKMSHLMPKRWHSLPLQVRQLSLWKLLLAPQGQITNLTLNCRLL